MEPKFRKIYCMMWSSRRLKQELLLYGIILKPIWTYGVVIWGIASESNREIIRKVLQIATNVPWFTMSKDIQTQCEVEYVNNIINNFKTRYL